MPGVNLTSKIGSPGQAGVVGRVTGVALTRRSHFRVQLGWSAFLSRAARRVAQVPCWWSSSTRTPHVLREVGGTVTASFILKVTARTVAGGLRATDWKALPGANPNCLDRGSGG